MNIFKKIIWLLPAAGALLVSGNVFAATMYLVPAEQASSIGQEVSVQVLIDSEGSDINAAQAVIRFPGNILSFSSVDRSKSVFGFWVEDPSVSDSALSFIGGTTQGISGKSLQAFTAKFKVIGSGKANFSIGDAIVTAADGKGTNILTSAKGGSVTVSVSSVSPAPAAAPQEQPSKIVRAPASASKLPSLPVLKVNLYPDPARWYNQKGEAIVLWNLPEDVSQVAATIDRNPNGIPADFGKDLSNGKNFGELEEGVWYAHVRFKNNVGNSPVASYRLAIDRTAPPLFKVVSVYGLESDNPQPLITYSAKDSLSGIEKYIINVGPTDVVETKAEEVKLPVLSPGKATISVTAVDQAGNSTKSSVDLNIKPLPSPVITFIRKDVFAGEGGLILRGTSGKDLLVSAIIRDGNKSIVASAVAAADRSGNWEILINQPLKKGSYTAEAVSQDSRGARSFPVVSEPFKVRVAPLLTILGISITATWFFLGLIIILIVAFGSGFIANLLWRKQMDRKSVIAQRDASNVFEAIKKDVETMLSHYKDAKISEMEAAEMEFILKKVKANLEKMKKYIVQSIGEISD